MTKPVAETVAFDVSVDDHSTSWFAKAGKTAAESCNVSSTLKLVALSAAVTLIVSGSTSTISSQSVVPIAVSRITSTHQQPP